MSARRIGGLLSLVPSPRPKSDVSDFGHLILPNSGTPEFGGGGGGVRGKGLVIASRRGTPRGRPPRAASRAPAGGHKGRPYDAKKSLLATRCAPFRSSPPGIAVRRTASFRSPMTRWSMLKCGSAWIAGSFGTKTALRAFCPTMTNGEHVARMSTSSWPDLLRSRGLETVSEIALLPHCYHTMKGTDKAGKGY